MHDSVPSTRYSSVCNVLRQWNISLIPTYRVYRLYDIMYMLELNIAIKVYRANKIFVVWNINIYDIKGNVTIYSKRIKY